MLLFFHNMSYNLNFPCNLFVLKFNVKRSRASSNANFHKTKINKEEHLTAIVLTYIGKSCCEIKRKILYFVF